MARTGLEIRDREREGGRERKRERLFFIRLGSMQDTVLTTKVINRSMRNCTKVGKGHCCVMKICQKFQVALLVCCYLHAAAVFMMLLVCGCLYVMLLFVQEHTHKHIHTADEVKKRLTDKAEGNEKKLKQLRNLFDNAR